MDLALPGGLYRNDGAGILNAHPGRRFRQRYRVDLAAFDADVGWRRRPGRAGRTLPEQRATAASRSPTPAPSTAAAGIACCPSTPTATAIPTWPWADRPRNPTQSSSTTAQACLPRSMPATSTTTLPIRRRWSHLMPTTTDGLTWRWHPARAVSSSATRARRASIWWTPALSATRPAPDKGHRRVRRQRRRRPRPGYRRTAQRALRQRRRRRFWHVRTAATWPTPATSSRSPPSTPTATAISTWPQATRRSKAARPTTSC